MGLINFLKNILIKDSQNIKSVQINNNNNPNSNNKFFQNEIHFTESICPYCEIKLEKIPSNKKKCPNCKNTIFVRSNPYNRNKLLITKNQVEEIKAIKENISKQKWIKKICNNHNITQSKFNKFKTKLEKKFNSFPDDYDVLWGLLNGKSLEYTKKHMWGFYAIAIMHMADTLYKENKSRKALNYYLEVCYLDINGPRNFEGYTEEDLKNESLFNPKTGSFAPYVIDQVYKSIIKSNLSIENTKQIFINHNTKIKNLHIPMSPVKAWTLLEKEIYSYEKNNL